MRALTCLLSLMLAAAAGWWTCGLLVTRQATERMSPVYDHQVAYHLASLAVPADTEEYFMFDLNPGSDSDQQARQMAKAFAAANKEGTPLGVTGDDPAHNQAVLQQAVTQSQGAQYSQMTLIVVGPRAQRKSTQAIVAPSGARLLYFAYP